MKARLGALAVGWSPVRLPHSWYLAGRKRPVLGLGPLLGLSLASIALIVSLGRLVAIGIIENNAAQSTLTVRSTRGLTATMGFIGDERTRTLLAAEAAASLPTLPSVLAAGDPSRALAQVQAARKTASPSLLAIVDAEGRVLAADPATNVPLAQVAPVKQALAGKSASGPFVDSGTLVYLAAAPIESNGRLLGAVVAIQRLDDPFLTTALRDDGLAGALISQDRILAATSPIRTRYTQSHDQPVTLHPASGGQLGQLVVGQTTFPVADQQLTSLGPGREVTLVVGLPPREGSLFAPFGLTPFEARVDLVSALVATLLAGAIGFLVGSYLGRSILQLRESTSDVYVSPLVGREVGVLASALAGERAATATRAAAANAEATRLRAVLDAIGEGIIVSDRERHVVLTNHAARTFLGLNGASPNGAVIALLPPPRGSAEIRANARILRSYSAPVASADDSFGVVTVLHDTTAERESERLQSEFLSVVSHELRTPLTAIVGAADLMLDDEPSRLSPEQTRFLSAIRRNGDRLIGLVNDLLDVSRLEAGRVELDRQPIDLALVARSSVRSLAHLFEQKDQTIDLDLPSPNDPPVPPVLADRRRIEQIIANLLGNAAQYTQAGGHIRLAVDSVGSEVVLSVADDGPGISGDDQTHIFEKFFRGPSAAGRHERGSGLGLAIVRSLVELHGGRIWVESAPGRGARFSVALPLADEGDE